MAHLMSDLRHCVVVGKKLVVRGALLELMGVKGYIAIAPDGRSFGWPFLHLIRVDVHRLNVFPLEPALRAVILKVMLRRPNAGNIATNWAIAGSAGFLVVDAEIGVVSEKIELVAKRFYDCAGKILRLGESDVVKRFIHHTERTILAR